MSKQIQKKRQQQKVHYDKSARTLGTLKPDQVVRIQTTKGHDKIGVVKRAAKEPRSYMVESNGRIYRRNRRHLLAVPEKVPKVEEEDESSSVGIPVTTEFRTSGGDPEDTDLVSSKTTQPNVLAPPNSPRLVTANRSCSGLRKHPIVTRSGRVSKPNSKYQDYE